MQRRHIHADHRSTPKPSVIMELPQITELLPEKIQPSYEFIRLQKTEKLKVFPFRQSFEALPSCGGETQMIVRVWCESGAGWTPTHVPVTPRTSCRDVLECCREPGDEPCLLLSVHPQHGGMYYRERRGLDANARAGDAADELPRRAGVLPRARRRAVPAAQRAPAARSGAGWTPTHVPVTPRTSCRDVLECCREPGDEPCLLLSVHPQHGGMYYQERRGLDANARAGDAADELPRRAGVLPRA
ncbi:Apoptosis-stimulating of p53 protein 1, partial [Operophtera brumata]